MSFDLSSIVRTRQKLFSFFLIASLLLLFLGPQASLDIALATEFDNIDSFDVHPANRWTEVNDGYTVTASEGLLNCTDIGDNTYDHYQIERDLRDLDGTIEIKFKLDSNSSSSSYQNGLNIKFEGDTANDHVWFWLLNAKNDSYYAGGSMLRYSTTDGSTDDLVLNSAVYDNTWYVFRIDYNILQSEFRTRLYFENHSKVFDYNAYDVVESDNFADIFGCTSFNLELFTSATTTGNKLETLIDYVNAPFKEREWSHFNDATDAHWLTETWDTAYVEEDCVDDSEFRLVVPNLDSVMGVMVLNSSDNNNIFGDSVNEDYNTMRFTVYTVDADDGDLHAGVSVVLGLISYTTSIGVLISIEIDGVTLYGNVNTQANATGTTINPKVAFAISTTVDRSQLSVQARIWIDADTPEEFFDVVGNGLISAMSTVPSQEFVLATKYSMSCQGEVITYTGSMTGFEIISDAQFHDFGGQIGEVVDGDGEPSGSLGNLGIFQGLFDAIAGFLDWVFGGLFEGVTNILDDVFGALGSLASDIWSGIGTALDFITTAIDGIVGLLVAALDDFIAGLLVLAEDAADLLFAVIAFLLILVLDIVEAMWAVAEKTIFFIWDALSLPDVVEIFTLSLAYITEFVQWLVVTLQSVIELAADLSWLILVGWWVWALPVQWARAKGDPLAGLGNFIEVYFYDLVPWEVIGFHIYVPQGIAATLWMILLLPETFILFTALGV